MSERARRLGGRVEVLPAPGGGTRVALAVPLDSETPEPLSLQDLEAHGPARTAGRAIAREVATLGAGPAGSTGTAPPSPPAEPDASTGGQ
jgi:hypothetical protein